MNNFDNGNKNTEETNESLSSLASLLSDELTVKLNNLTSELDDLTDSFDQILGQNGANIETVDRPQVEKKKPEPIIEPVKPIESAINVVGEPVAQQEVKQPTLIEPINISQEVVKKEDKPQTDQVPITNTDLFEGDLDLEKELAKHVSRIAGEVDESKLTLNKKTKEKKKVSLFGNKKKKKKQLPTVELSAGGGNNNVPPNHNKSKKESDRPKAKKATFVWAVVMCSILFLGVLGAAGAGFFAYKLCQNKPEFSAADLEAADSTIIYDVEGNELIELGLYLRENIEYEQLPNCVIDAFVSIEDSRYFEHFGFDIPRFTKAILANLSSGSFGQGGSTITMQLIKNSYFQVDNDGDSTIAARSGMSGIQRKMQEIVLAIEANYKLSKQEILMLFLNKVNFGDNIRGIEKAAEYYFGKHAKDLNLNEACFLAGIINAPNGFNPYNELYKYDDSYIYLSSEIEYLQNANDRKNEVLDLMAYHGYISQSEADLNKNVRIEDLVVGKSEKFNETNTYYQSFIDAVINEAQEVTGKNPYTTAMNIYTSMDPHMQEYVYNMQNNPEMFAKYYQFRHDDQQNALVILNNQTGELVALGGGRNQADEARQFNRATDSYINPGSTIKPVIEYTLAFDWLGYATSHTITDQPVFLYETDLVISNAYGQSYTGDMMLTEALARSLNTPAIQLMYDLLDEYDEQPIIDYCQSIGLDYCNKNTFDVQWAIGGKDCLVSPVQLAGAYGVILHDGAYIKPHTIKRIEYRGKYNETPDYMADTQGTQVVSSAAAYMTASLLQNNVESGWISQLNLIDRKYPTYAKTGTTNFSENAYTRYDIPETGAKDQWLSVSTSNYTVVVWNGFDELADGAFFTVADETYNLKCKLGSLIIDELMDYYQYDADYVERPDGVKDIEHLLGCFPYAKGEGAKGLIKEDSPYATLVDESSIENEVKGGKFYHTGIYDNGDGKVTIHWDEFNSYIIDEEGNTKIDMTVTSVSGDTTVPAFGRSYYQRYTFARPDMFYATLTLPDGQEMPVESTEPTITVDTGQLGPYKVCGWTSANPTPKCNSTTVEEESED